MEANQNKPSTEGVTKKTLILTAIGCVVAASAISFGVSYSVFAKKDTIPQVRFVNMAALNQDFTARFTDDKQKADALKTLNANLNYLGSRGVVLFNTAQVVSAPAALLINHESLLPPKAKDEAKVEPKAQEAAKDTKKDAAKK